MMDGIIFIFLEKLTTFRPVSRHHEDLVLNSKADRYTKQQVTDLQGVNPNIPINTETIVQNEGAISSYILRSLQKSPADP